MNDIGKIGVFIQQLRKEKSMTQKELAAKLDVTDKAVSKWERGLGCPDISLIMPLAKILGVSTSELLSGEKNAEPLHEAAESAIEETILYSDKSTKRKTENIKKFTLIGLTISFLITVCVCVICDFCITGELGWSLIVIGSLVFAWLLLLPFFTAKGSCIRKALLVLTLIQILYMGILGWCLNNSMVFKLGSCISILCLVWLWCIYAVCSRLRERKLRAAGIFFLTAVPGVWGIQKIVGVFVVQGGNSSAESVMNTVFLIVLAAICFGADYMASRK